MLVGGDLQVLTGMEQNRCCSDDVMESMNNFIAHDHACALNRDRLQLLTSWLDHKYGMRYAVWSKH